MAVPSYKALTMKALLRSGPVTSLLGALIWGWMALIARTVRWRIEGADGVKAAWTEAGGVIAGAWHSRIMLLPSGWLREFRPWRARPGPVAMLISLSPDGEPVAKAIRWLGLVGIRGSKANRRKRDKDKGGGRAIAEAVQHLREGGALCITPDGPRGPREEVGLGPILLAQRAGVPIVPYALASAPCWRLDTWDRFVIPLPFTRGAIVFGEPLTVERDRDVSQLRAELQRRMDAAQARADALASGQDAPLEPRSSRAA